jgi:hypothetical protein
MNAKELASTLTRTFKAKLPDITEGPSGLGKTEIKHQVAAKLGMNSLLLHPSTLDQVDLGGYPLTMEVNGTKRILRCFDDLLASVFEAKDPTLLHIDEIGQADHAVQKAIAPFVSPERRINNYTLPECVAVSLSTNSTVHRTGSVPILVHIRSRVATTLHLEPNLDAFLERATMDELHPYIMSYLKHSPTMLYELEMLPEKLRKERGLTYDKVYTSGEGYTCPRSWYRTHELLGTDLPEDLQQEIFSGTIGEVASTQFVTHCRHARQNLDLDSIVNKGNKFKFPGEKEPGLRWAFAYGVASLATKRTLGRVFEIANELHADNYSEYGMLIGQQTMGMTKKGFVTHPEFDKFIRSPLGKLIMNVQL